jgi:REP element-mobilizing transposase RayT
MAHISKAIFTKAISQYVPSVLHNFLAHEPLTIHPVILRINHLHLFILKSSVEKLEFANDVKTNLIRNHKFQMIFVFNIKSGDPSHLQ